MATLWRGSVRTDTEMRNESPEHFSFCRDWWVKFKVSQAIMTDTNKTSYFYNPDRRWVSVVFMLNNNASWKKKSPFFDFHFWIKNNYINVAVLFYAWWKQICTSLQLLYPPLKCSSWYAGLILREFYEQSSQLQSCQALSNRMLLIMPYWKRNECQQS